MINASTFILPLVMAAGALILLFVGIHGRRSDDHPICRRCGFDLFGLPAGSRHCSECGANIADGRAVRQADRSSPWLKQFGQIIEMAHDRGELSRQDWSRYAGQSMTFILTAPPAPPDRWLLATLKLVPRTGAACFRYESSFHEISIDGRSLPVPLTYCRLEASEGFSGFPGHLEIPFNGGELAALGVGNHELAIPLAVDVCEPDSLQPKVHADIGVNAKWQMLSAVPDVPGDLGAVVAIDSVHYGFGGPDERKCDSTTISRQAESMRLRYPRNARRKNSCSRTAALPTSVAGKGWLCLLPRFLRSTNQRWMSGWVSVLRHQD